MRTRDILRGTTLPLASLSLILLLGSCFSLARSEPPQQHYVLGGEARDGALDVATPDGLVIGIRRLRLAAYLDPPYLVIRRGQNRITYSEYHRWGEPLGAAINRTVANYLSARAGIRAVDVAPWPAGAAFDYLVQIHVERFEGIASQDSSSVDGTIQMRATWEILRPSDGTILARGSTEHQDTGWTVEDYAGLVRSLDAGLNAMSAELAASLVSLGTPTAVTSASMTLLSPLWPAR